MNIIQETELKFLLDRDKYNDLLTYFEWEKPYSQINFYYMDNDRKLLKDNTTVRVRGKKDGLRLQAKLHEAIDGAKHINKEYEANIETVPYEISGHELQIMSGKEFPDVKLIGYLVTERYICKKYMGVEICLDRNIYLGTIDYELEIEYSVKDLPKDITRLIELHNLDVLNRSRGKCKRFLDRLIEKEKQDLGES